jgi:hypothetical protein
MKLCRTIPTAVLLLVITCVSLGAASKPDRIPTSFEEEEGWTAIATVDGLLFVWNARGLYFTLLLKGKEVKPFNDLEHIFFNIDGTMLQIQLASIANFAPDAKQKKLDDRAILVAHRDWESKFIGDLLHNSLKLQTFNAKLSNGRDAMVWQFDMPEGMRAEAKKQLYLTLVQNQYVLLLNTEATASTADTDGRKFLLDTIGTLKVSPAPIDVKKLSDSIRSGARP